MKTSMLIKILLLIPLVFILVTQLVSFHNGKDSDYIHGQDSVTLPNFDIAAVGDWGCSDNTRNTVKNIITKNPELVLGLGDYSYRNDAKCWLQIINPIYDKMKIVIGNHDVEVYIDGKKRPAPERLVQYLNAFNLTTQYYSFDYQNVHFVAMSTEMPYGKDSKQYNFVKSDLEKTVSEKKAKWIIVFYHELAYSSPSLSSTSLIKFRETYHPLFEQYNVDLVLQAHHHAYQRTYPLKFNTLNTSNPIISNTNTANYSDPAGQIFITVGTAGVNLIHNFTGTAPYTITQFNSFGFLNLHVLDNGTKLVGEFYDNDGHVKDHFSLIKTKSKQNNFQKPQSPLNPTLTKDLDKKFKIEPVIEGLDSPSDMAFLSQNDIIVLEKNKGTVQRIVKGKQLDNPLIDVNVLHNNERGLVGTLVPQSKNMSKNIYLYYTEANSTSNKCPKPDYCLPGVEPIGNRLYRYELSQDGTKLINPKLMLNLPAVPGPGHNGGKMTMGPDNSIFLVIGDLMGHRTKAQNYADGEEPDATGGVLHFSPVGQPLGKALLGKEYPENLYYAYGIRNSFGLDFDPVTGNLWDTENGPDYGDEINLVDPGFNSGWKDVQGIWEQKGGKPQKLSLNPDKLENFNGEGKYSEPEFTFFNTVGVTAIKFFNSDKFGLEYKDGLFVGDFKNGNIYHFDLTEERQALLLNGSLSDKIADIPEELQKVIFAVGFSGITDLEVGPDGNLYVLDYGKGTIFKITPI
jgi:glucose/arabinose dehydrogenase